MLWSLGIVVAKSRRRVNNSHVIIKRLKRLDENYREVGTYVGR